MGTLDRLPLRVLVVIDSLGLGGAERLLVPFASGATAAGLDLQVASISSATDVRSEMVPALREVGIEPQFLGIRRLLSPHAIPTLASAIRASRCDVVHAHLEYAATLATPAARLVGRPTVCTFHHVPQEMDWRATVRERLAVEVASRSERVIFVSQASLEAFAHRYHAPQRAWTVVPNGIDLAAFAPAAATFPDELGITPGTPVAILPAALRPMKGHHALLRSWPAILTRIPEAHLLIAGSGELNSELRALTESLGIGHAVTFAGYRKDVSRLVAASQLVVLPSETEALPTALIEAAAVGRASVAYRTGGVPEVVVDGVTGVLVEPGDLPGFAAAVGDLLSNGPRRAAMASAARRHAEDYFSVERWVATLRGIYDQAIAS